MKVPAAILQRPAPSGARLRRALVPGPRVRRRLIALCAVAALLAAFYLLWLRDSSLVAIERVEVTGLTSRDADRVRAALTSTAETMTTLHVDRERLERTAAAFPVVAAIEVAPDFPDGLSVHVIEHSPVAVVDTGEGEVPVAGDGSILAGVAVEGDVPRIDYDGAAPTRTLPAGTARESAHIAGAAPPVIAQRVETIGVGDDEARGLVAQVEDGPEIVFGDASHVDAKWAAAVRVLADEEAVGATYVDVRIPRRPVAGGLVTTTVTPLPPADDYAAPSTQYDPATGLPLDPATGLPVDPTTGVPVDPATGLPADFAADVPATTAPDSTAPAPQAVPETPATEPVAPTPETAPQAAPQTGGGATAIP